jgi:CHAT domain-containing protein
MKYLFAVIFLLFVQGAMGQTWEELYKQSEVLAKKGEYVKAVSAAQSSIEVAKKEYGATHPNYATSVNNLGVLYTDMGQYSKAELLYTEAKKIREKVYGRGHPDYANSLSNLSALYGNMGQYDKAVPLLTEAKEIFEKEPGKTHPGYAIILNNLASLQILMGRYDKAGPLLTEAKEIKEKVLGIKHPGYAASLNNLAVFYKTIGQYEKAGLLHIQAKEIIRETLGETHQDYAACLNGLVILYSEMGKYAEAVPICAEAKEIVKKVFGENHANYAISLENLSTLYVEMGYYNKAEPLLTEAKEILKKTLGEIHPDYAVSLNNLASLYQRMEQYGKAELLLLEAKKVLKKTSGQFHPDYAASLSNLAALYDDMGQYNKAEQLRIQSKDITLKAVGNTHPYYATSLNDLAKSYEKKMLFSKAEPLYIQANQILKNSLGKIHPSYAASLSDLAALYIRMKEYGKAVPALTEAKEILKKTLGQTHPDYAVSLNNLAILYHNTGQYSKAESLYVDAKKIWEKAFCENCSNYARNLKNIASFFQSTGDYGKAEPFLLSANSVDMISLKKAFYFLSENEKENYIQNNVSLIEANNSFIYNYPQASPELINQSFNLQLFFKSLTLASTRQVLEAVRSSPDSTVRSIFTEWQANKRLLAKQYTLPIASRMPALDSVEAVAEAYEKELVRHSASFDSLQTELKISMKDVRQKLQPDEAVVEFVQFQLYKDGWTDRVVYAAYILRKNDTVPIFVPLCDEKQLRQLFAHAGKDATDMVKQLYPLKLLQQQNGGGMGKKLYNLVWQPLEKYLTGITKIAYSPAGSLYGIAFHALPVSGTKLLMDKYQLQQYASTRQIARRTGNKENTVPQSIALFGNALFTMDSAAIVKNHHKGNFSSNPYPAQSRGNRDPLWKPLPGTGEEVRKIKLLCEQHKVAGAKIFTGVHANEQNLKALGGQAPQVLHIATHGFFAVMPWKNNKKNTFGGGETYKLAYDPLLRSGLVLAGANYAWAGKRPVDGVEDGIATAYEIAQLNLRNTELAVLSACETASGDIKGSEGVFGLQRAFKLAGVKKMIVSLWRVDDTYTAELMIAFYTYWLKGSAIKEAFDTAQNDMRKKYPPYYWAGFVLIE